MAWKHSLISLTAISLGVAWAPGALAAVPALNSGADLANDFDPADAGAPGDTIGGGARFSPPPVGAPEDTFGGGTRRVGPGCQLVPLVPDMPVAGNPVATSLFGLTDSDRPTFYFNWTPPSEPDVTSSMGFWLQEHDTTAPSHRRDGPQVFSAENVTLPDEAAILAIPVPEGKAIAPGQTYSWDLELYCDDRDRSQLFHVRGFIEGVTDDQMPELSADATVADRIVAYAENGIWYDYLDGLVAYYKEAQPDNWEDRVRAVVVPALGPAEESELAEDEPTVEEDSQVSEDPSEEESPN